MGTLLQTILSDASKRDTAELPVVASQVAAKFQPWAEATS